MTFESQAEIDEICAVLQKYFQFRKIINHMLDAYIENSLDKEGFISKRMLLYPIGYEEIKSLAAQVDRWQESNNLPEGGYILPRKAVANVG
jgi:hypothetical protein